jgi:hypothetical protein
MIDVQIKQNRTPRILAVFSYRFDAHLVPALIENIDPLVDGWISFDDRSSKDVFSNEIVRRFQLLQAAMDLGASWVLAIDPDERIEFSFVRNIREISFVEELDACSFSLREMYTSDLYRIDGIWGNKRQTRFLSLNKGIVYPNDGLHTQWSDFIPSPRVFATDFNLYHLKMICPRRRKARASLYNYLDPHLRYQSIGYDYLYDDAGAQFVQIPPGREYNPKHLDDGGLWMIDIESIPK